MPTFDHVQKKHVLEAMRRIANEGVPKHANSIKYDVLTPDGQRLPPKLVLSIASEIATGKPVPRNYFGGGKPTNGVLEALGFEIIRKTPAQIQNRTPATLRVGAKLNNDELSDLFKVGNVGGMRWSSTHNCLVIVADHTKSLYDDRWEGDVLLYTGMGRSGDQTLTGQNGRLARDNTTVHLFEVFKPNVYIYAGKAIRAGEIREERQPDDQHKDRRVYVFPLRLLNGGARPIPEPRDVEKIRASREYAFNKLSMEELKRRAESAGRQTPARQSMIGNQIERNVAIAVYVKRLANGKCDLCRQAAPFSTKNGPYLECHHIKHLAKGGADTVNNAVALCPNCHRKMHALDRQSDQRKLEIRVRERK